MQNPNTNIRTYFSIFGDEFPLDEFTNKIGITPTVVRTKGEIYKIGKTQHKSYTTTWTYEIDYCLTSDPTSQINKLVDIFSNKVNIINYYLKEFNLDSKIAIILVFPESSGLLLNQKLIKFANEINSEYEFDFYCDEI
ncbi:DUF4279 domain-containing protein [Solibacillus sp. FSL K6-1781]|uniref:DUF4279 domain-containing protein n=1 Tax=Solibacillus sp. FSL K6-1781 TaxID=2921474 RepID=UPI00315AC307